MTYKLGLLALAIATAVLTVSADARVRGPALTPEQYARVCHASCEAAENRCRARRCEGLGAVSCWADCTQKKWACDGACNNAVARTQPPQPPQAPQPGPSTTTSERKQSDWDRQSKESRISACKSNCSSERFGCESSCRMRSAGIDQDMCMNTCRMSQSTCEFHCQ